MLPFASAMLAQPTGGGLYGSHAYWRVYCTDNNGGSSFIQVGEVEFLDSGGNVIPATGGTVIKSSIASGNNAAWAFDGNAASAWLSNSPSNEWIGYQYPTGKSVEKVRLTTNDIATGSPNGRAPLNCKLEYSDDGSSWTTAFTFGNYLPVRGHAETYPFVAPPSGYHRAWRVFCDNNNGGSSFIDIDELEFRATAGGADQTEGAVGDFTGTTLGRAINSSAAISSEGFRCFTGGTDLWHSNGTTNQWVGFIFGDAVKVEEISVKTGGTASRSPKDMHVQYTDDGITWTTQKDLASQTGWSSSETRVLAAI